MSLILYNKPPNHIFYFHTVQTLFNNSSPSHITMRFLVFLCSPVPLRTILSEAFRNFPVCIPTTELVPLCPYCMLLFLALDIFCTFCLVSWLPPCLHGGHIHWFHPHLIPESWPFVLENLSSLSHLQSILLTPYMIILPQFPSLAPTSAHCSSQRFLHFAWWYRRSQAIPNTKIIWQVTFSQVRGQQVNNNFLMLASL